MREPFLSHVVGECLTENKRVCLCAKMVVVKGLRDTEIAVVISVFSFIFRKERMFCATF